MVEAIYGLLAERPYRVGRPLRFELEGKHSAYRGDYRVIYQIDEPVDGWSSWRSRIELMPIVQREGKAEFAAAGHLSTLRELDRRLFDLAGCLHSSIAMLSRGLVRLRLRYPSPF